jgi:hypothetical protein
MRVFLRWYETEYEPEGWANPIRKVNAPKVPQEPLQPVNLVHVKAMLDTCKRRTFLATDDDHQLAQEDILLDQIRPSARHIGSDRGHQGLVVMRCPVALGLNEI